MKKLVCLLVAVTLAVSCLAPSALAADDVTGHWSEPYFRALSAHNVINANGRGDFTPNSQICRAEFMRYLNRAFGFTEQADVSAYTDVSSNQWYYETVRIAVKYGYISGISSTKMNPEGPITREQVITILGRLCKLETELVKPDALSFTDKKDIADWSAPYIKWGVDGGYISGYPDKTFRPKRVTTRAEAAKILYTFLGTMMDKADTAYTGTSLNQDTDNVLVSKACTLRDMTVPGNLIISEGVGKGTVTLSNVTVKGRLIAAGGSILFDGVKAEELYVSSAFPTQAVQLAAAGQTAFGATTVVTNAALTQSALSTGAAGFGTVTVTGAQAVTLSGSFPAVVLSGKNGLTVNAGATVGKLTVNGAANIGGAGVIQSAQFKASGATSTIAPDTYSFGAGVYATINGQTVSTDRTELGNSVTPTTTTYDRYGGKDLTVTLRAQSGAALRFIALDSAALQMGTDYIYETQTGAVTFPAQTMSTLATGGHTLTFVMSDGTNPTLSLTVETITAQSVVTPVSARFSLTPGSAENRDVTAFLNIDSNTVIQAVFAGSTQLQIGTQYTIDGTRVILFREALTGLGGSSSGQIDVTFHLSDGTSPQMRLYFV